MILYVQVSCNHMLHRSHDIIWHNVLHRSHNVVTSWEVPYGGNLLWVFIFAIFVMLNILAKIKVSTYFWIQISSIYLLLWILYSKIEQNFFESKIMWFANISSHIKFSLHSILLCFPYLVVSCEITRYINEELSTYW